MSSVCPLFMVAGIGDGSGPDYLNKVATELNQAGAEALYLTPIHPYRHVEQLLWNRLHHSRSMTTPPIHQKRFLDITKDEIHELVDTDILAAFAFACAALLKFMKLELESTNKVAHTYLHLIEQDSSARAWEIDHKHSCDLPLLWLHSLPNMVNNSTSKFWSEVQVQSEIIGFTSSFPVDPLVALTFIPVSSYLRVLYVDQNTMTITIVLFKTKVPAPQVHGQWIFYFSVDNVVFMGGQRVNLNLVGDPCKIVYNQSRLVNTIVFKGNL
ncbi:hypothetical protein F4604DRAFT_2032063 [Suillus subluteus]|nr:hypothetical protein F4604DRAFT_2032063 [Suillus subluteus]